MEDARTSTGSQRLASTFDTLIERPENGIIAISVRPESFSTGNNRDIPVSVQEQVYGRKTARVETSPKSLDRHHELISSSEEVHAARKDRGTSERPIRRNWLKERKTAQWKLPKPPKAKVHLNSCQTSPRSPQRPTRRARSSPSLHKKNSASTSAQKAQENPKDQQEGQAKGETHVEQALPADLKDSPEIEDSHGQSVQYGKNSYGI
ncbi:hypothetical protein O181_081093 [Austropuccinia psidii MF-1]|uniref:Uncharacterized protein n=1 Tax=Austropuccinia psidii MF-1 TaxID=1389203 RepID=A0A9Q3FP61_9BASI|nr:hypothetical protein [Austropuccinia psidii MF-1]